MNELFVNDPKWFQFACNFEKEGSKSIFDESLMNSTEEVTGMILIQSKYQVKASNNHIPIKTEIEFRKHGVPLKSEIQIQKEIVVPQKEAKSFTGLPLTVV